jgi:hypothetical protein
VRRMEILTERRGKVPLMYAPTGEEEESKMTQNCLVHLRHHNWCPSGRMVSTGQALANDPLRDAPHQHVGQPAAAVVASTTRSMLLPCVTTISRNGVPSQPRGRFCFAGTALRPNPKYPAKPFRTSLDSLDRVGRRGPRRTRA